MRYSRLCLCSDGKYVHHLLETELLCGWLQETFRAHLITQMLSTYSSLLKCSVSPLRFNSVMRQESSWPAFGTALGLFQAADHIRNANRQPKLKMRIAAITFSLHPVLYLHTYTQICLYLFEYMCRGVWRSLLTE